ncbi:hypothetical protein GW17_00049153 [Ensete ventricosum]|nr:hypothetical protein GW17_00049153 [Ensete ventricosum]
MVGGEQIEVTSPKVSFLAPSKVVPHPSLVTNATDLMGTPASEASPLLPLVNKVFPILQGLSESRMEEGIGPLEKPEDSPDDTLLQEVTVLKRPKTVVILRAKAVAANFKSNSTPVRRRHNVPTKLVEFVHPVQGSNSGSHPSSSS